MKYLGLILVVLGLAFSCKTSNPQIKKDTNASLVANDTVKIANEEVGYEIIIIEPGFNYWLQSNAREEGYYSQQFLETRNIQFVIAYNQRVLQPHVYDPSLYEWPINYQQGIDYGYDVNYKLYNYFIYFQLKYKQQLTGFVPRI